MECYGKTMEKLWNFFSWDLYVSDSISEVLLRIDHGVHLFWGKDSLKH